MTAQAGGATAGQRRARAAPGRRRRARSPPAPPRRRRRDRTDGLDPARRAHELAARDGLAPTARGHPRPRSSKLDVPVAGGGRIQVYYLKHADAEELAETLNSLLGGGGSSRRRRGARACPAPRSQRRADLRSTVTPLSERRRRSPPTRRRTRSSSRRARRPTTTLAAGDREARHLAARRCWSRR